MALAGCERLVMKLAKVVLKKSSIGGKQYLDYL
jgi:hypothetical protein